MRNPESVSISPTETKYLKSGTRISAYFAEKKQLKTPSDTAQHEAKHAVVAILTNTGVESATIIPGPGYLGLTKLSGFNAAAAAADADGHGGTGHDLFIISASGHDVGSARSVARSVISSNRDEAEATASLIEERGIVSGIEIDQTIKEVRSKRGLDEVILFIKE
ncbi:MAG TPA: hypothetical protein VNA13_00150, partial [Xanthomonadales bacterium]|nr:hypothetical protein [Xanthomonadales bacterium]